MKYDIDMPDATDNRYSGGAWDMAVEIAEVYGASDVYGKNGGDNLEKIERVYNIIKHGRK